MLSDPPPDEQGRYRSIPDASIWYDTYRGHLARVLATWGPPPLTPVLRKAFLKMWEEEQRYGGFWDIWYAQEAMLYASGRRGDFSVLEGIELPAERKRLAMDFLALGHVRADERFADLVMDMISNKGRLQKEVALALIERFALSEQEAIEHVKLFGSDYSARRTPDGAILL